MDIYDVSTGQWNSTAGGLSVARCRLAAATYGSIIIFAGGFSVNQEAVVDIYDISTGQWNSTSTGAGRLSVARENLVAAAAGGKIIFAGGSYVCRICAFFFSHTFSQ